MCIQRVRRVVSLMVISVDACVCVCVHAHAYSHVLKALCVASRWVLVSVTPTDRHWWGGWWVCKAISLAAEQKPADCVMSFQLDTGVKNQHKSLSNHSSSIWNYILCTVWKWESERERERESEREREIHWLMHSVCKLYLKIFHKHFVYICESKCVLYFLLFLSICCR